MLQKFVARLRDYSELTKARITSLIVLTAWCGYFFGAHRMGVSSWSLGLIQSSVRHCSGFERNGGAKRGS